MKPDHISAYDEPCSEMLMTIINNTSDVVMNKTGITTGNPENRA